MLSSKLQLTLRNRKVLTAILALVLLCSSVSVLVGYQLAKAQTSALTMQTQTGGVYAGAPSWTVYLDGSTYYAKNQWGTNTYSNINGLTLINEAIASLSSTTGGKVYLTPGSYSLTGTLLLQNNVALIGSGSNQTMLNFILTGSQNAISFSSIDTEKRVQIESLSINDVSHTTTGSALYLPNICRSTISDVNILGFRAGIGVSLYASGSVGSYWNIFTLITVDDAKTGFSLTSDGGGMRNNDNSFYTCRVNSPSITGDTGVYVGSNSGQANNWYQCDFSNLDTGMTFIDSLNNIYGGWNEANGVGIDVHQVTGITGRDITFGVTDTLPVYIVGGNDNRFYDCYNFVQENCSAAIILNGQATVTVQHGLINGYGKGVIPTDIMVTGGQNEVANVYVSAYTNTTITFSTYNGATVTDNRQIWWEAKYLS